MALADDFRSLLSTARQMVTDPAVKQAIADDIAALEAKAAQGIESLEQHVAAWFAAHYVLPAPAEDTGPGNTPAPAAAAPAEGDPASPAS